MKAFTNANARDLKHAVTLARAGAPRRAGRASFAGGGSDLLGLMKDRIVSPDVVVNLKTIKGLDQVDDGSRRLIDRRTDHARRAQPASGRPPRLRRAGRSGRERRDAADPQRRHAGRQRLPAAVVLVLPQRLPVLQERRQRPASRSPARTSSTPSSAAARATSSIPRTRRRRWSRSTRRSASSDRPASGWCRPPTSSRCRDENAARENVLGDDEVLASVRIAGGAARDAQHLSQGARSRSVDARRRQRRDRARDGPGRLPQRADRARRRRADSVAAAGGREACWPVSASRRRWPRRPARRPWPARARSRRMATRCR